MKKWELASYLIEAKKVIDSLWYIILNEKQIANLDLRSKVKDLRRKFYLNCGYVLENSGLNKKDICARNDSIKGIFYERDKNEAHKDEDYKGKRYSLEPEMLEIMKSQLEEVKKVCKNALPKVLTLNYIPYDRELFRFITGISPEKEEEIKKRKYSNYKTSQQLLEEAGAQGFLEDIEELRNLSCEEKEQIAVLMEDGICFEEGLQNRQDSCIRINCLYNWDMWAVPDMERYAVIKKLQEIGCLDVFGRLKEGLEKDKELMNKMIRILDEKGEYME